MRPLRAATLPGRALLRHLEGNRALTESLLNQSLTWHRDALLSIVAACGYADGKPVLSGATVPVTDVLEAITGNGLAIESLIEAVRSAEWAEHSESRG